MLSNLPFGYGNCVGVVDYTVELVMRKAAIWELGLEAKKNTTIRFSGK